MGVYTSVKFAETNSSSSGIGAFNLNLKSFIFQLITFVIVLLIIKRFVLPKLLETLEARRKTLEESLLQAKQIEEALAKAEARSEELLHKAREKADEALTAAKTEAKATVAKAEEAAQVQSARILAEAQELLNQQRQKMHEEIRREMAKLVALATQKVLRKKLSPAEDSRLIEESIKELV